ncbi:hypothetical protein EV05_1098 [Prochlorococcus sp. MIT 0601]|nr:hypothetical protein EV05_1098 [Prochlorococcus sp. MIT 0601]
MVSIIVVNGVVTEKRFITKKGAKITVRRTDLGLFCMLLASS